MKKVRETFKSKQDMDNIYGYIFKDSPKNADKQISRIIKHFEQISLFPNTCVPLRNIFDIDTDLKRSIVAPYIVITRHYETHIEIHSVFHSRQNYMSILFG
ncbi:MAG: type II toxin-antitoxin system RelE/ParE family toxin [Firmicutes bacterium]|nr:type II toxin-antitoxin system RelE/ParE family toxin [Bacillota bacterium]